MEIALPRRAGLAVRVRPPPALIAALVLAAAAGAWHARHIGAEADWDLRNYHLYDGFALLHLRLGADIAPAQLQSYYPPLLDLLHALALVAFNRHPALLGAVLALPQGLAGFLAYALARRLAPTLSPGPAIAAALIGVTGAAGAATFAGAMSEMLPAAALLGGMLLVDGRAPTRAGLLAGLAVGLKLTAAPYAAGLALAAPLAAHSGQRRAALARFAAGAAGGAALTAGWWWAYLWVCFGDPVFPYYNQIFHSPWIAAGAHTDARFLPHSLWGAMTRPWRWALVVSRLGGEVPLRDPRLGLGTASLAVLLVRRARLPQPPLLQLIAVIWVVGYALWAALFGVQRYLVTLELLSGPLLLAALAPLLARLPRPGQVGATLGLAMAIMAATVVPDWGHAPPGSRAVAVHLPPFPPGTLVILLDSAPMGYVAAFAPASVRFVGAANNLLHPGAPGLLEQAVTRAIRDQRGPLWGLQSTRHGAAGADATLRAYGLARAADCAPVRSNLDDNAILACPLRRVSG